MKRRPDGLVNIYHAAGVHDVALCVAKEDALLIVAAPDLAEALCDLVNHVLSEGNCGPDCDFIVTARKAIQKAGISEDPHK